VEPLVEAQYEACLEYVFGHPVWQRIRDGDGRSALLSYLLESRHYLAAAPFRMASGITDALRPSQLVELQAEHVVEEAGHDLFFENGLAAIGCDRELVREARPSPVTVEWVHLMRTVAAYSPLAAGICSGLLEHTAGAREAVSGWHEMLVEHGMLAESAVKAIFEHVQTDLGLGHGSNWRKAVRAAQVVPAAELADWLNAVTLVGEMIYRWLDSFERGLSSEVVDAMRELRPDGQSRRFGGEVDGLPVWPAEVYESFVHAPRNDKPGVRRALAVSYAFAGKAADTGAPGIGAAARDFTRRAARDTAGGHSADDLLAIVDGWLTAIDGHQLWTELSGNPTLPLVYGWMVENQHYVSGIWQHTGAAISACPDPLIRAELVKHLTEEFAHGKMFRRGIESGRGAYFAGLPVHLMRPLATTVSYVGTLRELSLRDWKGYLLALAFLQRSLGAENGGLHERHDNFYRAMFERLPEAMPVVAAMRHHDLEDTSLGHGDDARDLLTLLVERHEIGADSFAAAAIIPQLTWSFLDGILQHYRHGDGAVLQRVGWHVAA
jgi:pyrroloquinoline quinone (PQQ) biosynthesis protein C